MVRSGPRALGVRSRPGASPGLAVLSRQYQVEAKQTFPQVLPAKVQLRTGSLWAWLGTCSPGKVPLQLGQVAFSSAHLLVQLALRRNWKASLPKPVRAAVRVAYEARQQGWGGMRGWMRPFCWMVKATFTPQSGPLHSSPEETFQSSSCVPH